jgi:drug/metabolite transporter (DMT)-like permease
MGRTPDALLTLKGAGFHQTRLEKGRVMKATTMDLPDRTTLTAFFALSLIGGLNVVAVKLSNEELAPLFGAAVRFSAAAVLLFAFAALRRIPMPRGRALVGAIIYGVLGFAAFYALAYWALVELSAGVGAVVLGSVPLLTLIFAGLHRIESIHRRGLLGAMLAIAGIAVLVSGPSDARVAVLPLLAALGAAAAGAESGVVMKLFPPAHLVATNAVGMGVGSVLLFLSSAAFGEPWTAPSTTSTWAAYGYLVTLGSVGLFGLFLFTLKRWTASGVSYMTVIMPIVSAVAGSLLLDEPITSTLLLGGLIVLAGVYVGALSGHRPEKRTATPVASPAEEPASV